MTEEKTIAELTRPDDAQATRISGSDNERVVYERELHEVFDLQSIGPEDAPAFLINNIVKIYDFCDCETGIDYQIDYDGDWVTDDQAINLSNLAMKEIFEKMETSAKEDFEKEEKSKAQELEAQDKSAKLEADQIADVEAMEG